VLAGIAVSAVPHDLILEVLAGVRVFDRHLTGLTCEQVASVCRVAVPRAAGLTTGELAVLSRLTVIAVDPEAAARGYRQGVQEPNVVNERQRPARR